MIPGLASLVLSLFLVTHFIHSELNEQRQHFTRAIVTQLTASTADYLVTEDLLGLNVVLGTLVSQGDLLFASVYNTDNKLLAQAGKRGSKRQDIVTRDISFQNETAGYLQVVVNQTALDNKLNTLIFSFAALHLLVLGALGLFVWYFADLIFLGLFSVNEPQASVNFSTNSDTPQQTQEEQEEQREAIPAPKAEADNASIILVMKIRPHRWLAAHEERISGALSLYRCKVEVSEGQDIVAMFSGANAKDCLYDAICAGLLLIQVFGRLNTTINIKIGINLVPDLKQVEAARKQTVYIASLAERQLLLSNDAYQLCFEDSRLVISEYYNSLMPIGSVYLVESLQPAYQKLIGLQALQLSKG
jgi:uncharacterized membrane protein affecting hemolysin expression